MATLATPQSPWQPRQPGGLGVGALLALLAHAALVAALALGVAWRTRPSDAVVSAELWSAVPQVAAPAPVEPPPQPPAPVRPSPPPPRPDPRLEQQQRDAQIAIEQAERRKQLERQAQERRREEQLKEDKRRQEQAAREAAAKEAARKAAAARAEEERLARQREENLARIRGLAGASGPSTSTGQALRDAAPSASYAGRIMARIKPNIVLTGEVPDSAETTVEVKCAPDGRIVGRRIVRSTGHALWEEAVLRAIDRTEMLPRDVDGRVPATLPIVFRRKE